MKPNADKTDFIWLGTRQQLSKVAATPLQVVDQLLQPTDAVRNLGVLTGSQLTMEAHVWNDIHSGFCQLWQLRSIWRLWPPNLPDLNPFDYSVWGTLQQKVYKTCMTDELKHRIRIEWTKLDHAIIAAAVHQWHRHLSACVKAGSDHFKDCF